MRGKQRKTSLRCQTFPALTLNLFKNYCLFEKINQTLHSVFHPIFGHLLGDGIFDERLAPFLYIASQIIPLSGTTKHALKVNVVIG